MHPATAVCVWLCFLLLAPYKGLAAPSYPLSDWLQGTASFFGGRRSQESNDISYKLTINSGSCGYGDIDPRLYPNYNVAGLHFDNALVMNRSQAACGSCLEIECMDTSSICYPSSPVQVMVTDQCDEDCNATNVNMHVFSFEQLAAPSTGRINIRYRLVACEPADPIAIHIESYRPTDGGWIRLAFKNVAGDAALTSVEMAAGGSDAYAAGRRPAAAAADPASPWTPMANTFGAMWEIFKLPAEPPLDLRITNSIGQVVVIRDAVAFVGITGDVQTTAQFPITAGGVGSGRGAAPISAMTSEPRNEPSSSKGLPATNDSAASAASNVPTTTLANPSAASNVPATTQPDPSATSNVPTTTLANPSPVPAAAAANNSNSSNQVTVGVALPQPPQDAVGPDPSGLGLAPNASINLNATIPSSGVPLTNSSTSSDPNAGRAVLPAAAQAAPVAATTNNSGNNKLPATRQRGRTTRTGAVLENRTGRRMMVL